MWSKNKKLTLLLILTGILALLVAGTFFVTKWLLPHNAARNTMDPEGLVTVQTMDDGTVQIQWPEGENAQYYELQILEADGTVLHSCTAAEPFADLPELPSDRDLTARIASCRDFGKHSRKGDKTLEAVIRLDVPQIRDLSWLLDTDADTVDISFGMAEGDLCRVYLTEGDSEPVQVEELRSGKMQLRFGEGQQYPMPAHGKKLRFTFRAERSAGNVFYLSDYAEFTLTREDLLDKALAVECTDNGENSYTLTWNETKGEHYEILLATGDSEIWQTLATIACDQERIYETGHLDAYTDYTFQVVAVGGQTMPDSEFAAMSEPIQVRTGAKLMYSTIWPIMDQPVYADTEATQELGTATAGSAWCVLGLEGQYLKIFYAGQEGYIDSDYCMINLPEYIGNLCLYNITNSYSAIYTVHEFGIKKVSGALITGYENVKIGENKYLVPLLFPTAQRLIPAGEAARAAGYALKIYDSFRPQDATNQLFYLTSSIMGDYVPNYTYTGKTVKDLHKLEEPEETEPPATTPPAEEPTEPAAEPEPPAQTPQEPAPTEGTASTTLGFFAKAASPNLENIRMAGSRPQNLTFKSLMTNYERYRLSSFLAPGLSRHNFGVALDLTLANADGKDLTMQTSMHDLSWYSISKRNNTNANTLYNIMTGAGFHNIFSEWWHFQDDVIYQKHLYKPLKGGISWACWVTDGDGWRYRLNDGSFYTDCIQTIDGRECIFDKDGYVYFG